VLYPLLSTALLMGLLGGPHCIAMCAAPCAWVTQAAPGVVHLHDGHRRRRLWLRGALFHSARLLGYASLGTAAALSMQSLSWLSRQSTALQSLWALSHVAVMGWGLLMLLQARQPAWLEAAGRGVWAKVRPWVAAPGGSVAAGCAWALMPCGLLYSAVLVAALSGSAARGALTMAAFAVGSGLWLLAAPWLWRCARQRLNARRAHWGTRFGGLALAAVSLYALWLGWVHQPALWCR